MALMRAGCCTLRVHLLEKKQIHVTRTKVLLERELLDGTGQVAQTSNDKTLHNQKK
jgi:hypothetical protein